MEEQNSCNEVIISIENPANDTVADDDDAKNERDEKEEEKQREATKQEVQKKKLPFERTYTVGMAQNVYYGYGGGLEPPADEFRSSFIRKTFAIVFIMLLVTALCVLGVRFEGTFLNEIFIRYGQILMISSSIGLIGMSYVFACIPPCRNPPLVIFAVMVGVILMTVLTAAITVRYKTDCLLIATAATVVVVGLATLISFSSFDFTRWFAVVGFAMIGVMVASLILFALNMFLGLRMPILHLVLAIISTLIMSVSLIIELQMILGGRSVEVDEDEYMMAAYMVYTSVVYIFINIVQITGLLDMLTNG